MAKEYRRRIASKAEEIANSEYSSGTWSAVEDYFSENYVSMQSATVVKIKTVDDKYYIVGPNEYEDGVTSGQYQYLIDTFGEDVVIFFNGVQTSGTGYKSFNSLPQDGDHPGNAPAATDAVITETFSINAQGQFYESPSTEALIACAVLAESGTKVKSVSADWSGSGEETLTGKTVSISVSNYPTFTVWVNADYSYVWRKAYGTEYNATYNSSSNDLVINFNSTNATDARIAYI